MPRWVGQLDMRRASSHRLVVLALIFTFLNALKPLVTDDSAYYYYARQITRDPLRPYAFDIFWYQAPEPANSVFAPPLLPYWWSIALALFGERPFLWKLWLFPFSFLFVWALQGAVGPLRSGGCNARPVDDGFVADFFAQPEPDARRAGPLSEPHRPGFVHPSER